jgi:hypothetical protein
VINNKNQLYAIMIIFKEKHTNKNDYINDYKDIKELFINKFGNTTVSNDMAWGNDLYKNDIQYYGLSVSMGYLSYLSTWKFGDTEINNFLSGDNFKINHILRFVGNKYEEVPYNDGM